MSMIPDINLMPNSEQEDGSSKMLFVLLGIIVLLLLAIMSWLYFSAKAEVTSLTNEEQSLQIERDTLQMELTAMQGAATGSVEESLAFIEQISYPVTPVIDETKGLLPENTYLRDYSFGESAVTFSVDFETLNAVSSYISRLENSPYFLDVQVGSISNFDLGQEQQDDETRFSEVPRYTVEVTLAIDDTQLVTGGDS
jgi:Tfp pilus assembly protein PilN